MDKAYKNFRPNWFHEVAPDNSYRSIFRWGDPEYFKYPKEGLYKVLKERLNLTDEDFKDYGTDLGLEPVDLSQYPPNIDMSVLEQLKNIVGKDNVSTDGYDRLAVAYGKTGYDQLRMRNKRIDSLPDVVVYPAESKEIQQIVDLANEKHIPVYVYGGGSSVTRGVEPVFGGISLDMRKRFNRLISFNEEDQTVCVQAGMSGPALEELLNNAVTKLGAKRPYTCGHFPQSFEYSSVGGWVVTRGAGQNSTYYGCITDIVLGQKYATPIGEITTSKYPREATGPNLNQIMMGSEGAFGVLTEVTLKIFRYMPENRKRFSYIFKDWHTARKAAKAMMQAEAGLASVFRMSDPEETDVMLRLYNVDETPLWNLLELKGYKPMERCLFLGYSEGEEGYVKNVAKAIRKIAKEYGAMSLTGFVTENWEKGRFTDPYLRDTLLDFGVMTDTLECTVNWSNMEYVHSSVREVCHKLPHTIVTTHMSHCYPQGANLYFIFITKMTDAEAFKKYHSSILDAIQRSGAAMSHHHGIGKMFGPWLEGQLGAREYGIIRALKEYFDPNNIMNPGGTLGLDIEENEKRFLYKPSGAYSIAKAKSPVDSQEATDERTQ